MPVLNFYKKTSLIPKGETEGRPIPTRGARIRALGLPVKPNGSGSLTGTMLSFEGSYDGMNFFTINDFSGQPFEVTARAVQKVIPANSLKTFPAILPLQNSYLFEGIQIVRPRSNQVEAEDRIIEFYQELSDL
jgi:hypothetical protein